MQQNAIFYESSLSFVSLFPLVAEGIGRFLGQLPVKATGQVNAGDEIAQGYLIPQVILQIQQVTQKNPLGSAQLPPQYGKDMISLALYLFCFG